jgi:tRNA threonylcarbamoyladenosine biosynthesis protein TsaE
MQDMDAKITTLISSDAETTEQIAETVGRSLHGGEVIELVSDLGGGKTTFTRGLVRALGSEDTVSSPTFTISRVYTAGKLEVHHFDFYRLHEAGIIANELAEIASDPQTIIVVEWADVVQHVLPKRRLTVTISQQPNGDRQLVFSAPSELAYLTEGLQ